MGRCWKTTFRTVFKIRICNLIGCQEVCRLLFKVYCLQIIKTEPVYTCKKRLLTSFVALVSFENLYNLLLHKVGMCRVLKLIKLASKHDII